MQDFRNLDAWKLSRRLTVAIYRLTQRFPLEERFGLSLQLRRSAVSIGANIAEAFGRGTRADCARCLQVSVSEANEVLHHLITALDLGYASQSDIADTLSLLQQVRHKTVNLLLRVRPRRR